MHIILQQLILDNVEAVGFETSVTLLYGDDGKPLRTVSVNVLKDYIYMEHQYYKYRKEGNILFMWVVGR